MNSCCCTHDPRQLAAALIRWALGLLFLVGGIAKLTHLGGFVNGLPAGDALQRRRTD